MADVYKCTVLSVQEVSETACDLRILSPEIARMAAPGMFLHIKCDGFTLRRPISICDVDEDCIRIIVDRRGDGTQWLADRKKFDVLDVLGPLGRGFDVTGEKILVAGGGIGTPPLLYAAKMARSADAVIGFRSKAAAILLSDFNAVCASVQISTDDGSIGHKGYVSDLVEVKLGKEKYDRVLACGPHIMLKSVYEVCKKHNVPLQVSLEERMGCGIGACLVCACKTKGDRYSHVCKDGPVFDAEEVVWE